MVCVNGVCMLCKFAFCMPTNAHVMQIITTCVQPVVGGLVARCQQKLSDQGAWLPGPPVGRYAPSVQYTGLQHISANIMLLHGSLGCRKGCKFQAAPQRMS